MGYCGSNKAFYRNQSQKARIFKLIDQKSDEEKIQQGIQVANRVGMKLNKKSARKEYLKMFLFQQLQLCKNVSVLEPYDLPPWEQIMDNDQTFLSFLMNNQNQTMTSGNPILFDFKAPLELEIMLLRDSQT